MYHDNHPDHDYEMANLVEEFAPPHAISWQPGMGSDDANLELGGWIWRYDLRPVGEDQTEVTLTYDWSDGRDRDSGETHRVPAVPRRAPAQLAGEPGEAGGQRDDVRLRTAAMRSLS